MRLKKIISLSLALLTGISVMPAQLYAAHNVNHITTYWPEPGQSSIISQGDIYYLEKKGSSVYPEKYTFKDDGSDGDGIPTNSQLVIQNGEEKPIVAPWEQFYDGLSEKEKKEYILVRDKINITKKDKSGKPLNGIVFQIDKKDVCTTDVHGECTITFTDNKWGPMELVEIIPKYTYNKPEYKNKTIKLYRDPGTRFLGEVTGIELGINYDELRNKVKKNVPGAQIPEITGNSEYKSVVDGEENDGGVWLKFIDRDQFGKIHVFYVAKRSILKNISYEDIVKAGMAYGWDTIDPHNKKPRVGLTLPDKNALQNYTAATISNNNQEYIVRLLRGGSNYGDPIVKKKNGRDYEWTDAQNSEWDRTILPMTKQYRFDTGTKNSCNSSLWDTDKSGNFKIQTAQYNWFRDLTLGAINSFNYMGKSISSVGGQGQWNWTQEYSGHSVRRSLRGSDNINYGAAYSGNLDSDINYAGDGFRPVLEVAPKEYDGVVFEGEVTGNELGITYNDIRFNKDNTKRFPNALVPEVTGSNKQNADEIINQNKYEEANGGIWLKFTDYQYKRKNTKTGIEEPRTFYVAKKPILKYISWNDLHSAGMVYGWDVINPNTGLPRSNPEKYKNGSEDYRATILKNQKDNNKEYIVRLLQGKTNYSGDVTNKKIYRYDNDNNNSEWNRVMLPLVQGYRFGAKTDNNNYAEDLLR